MEAAPRPIVVGVKDFESEVPTTDRVALAVAAVRPPPSPDTLVELFVYVPSTAEVTATDRVQDAGAAASEAPESVTLPEPAAGAKVPPQLLVAAGVGATTRPAGSVSVKPTPVTAWPPGLAVTVNVRVAVPPGAILAGLNALVSAGPAKCVTLALAPVAETPVVRPEKLAAALLRVPAVAAVTFACTNSRSYTLEGATNLMSGQWSVVGGPSNGAAAGAMTMTDTSSVPSRSYRVNVSLP